MTQFDIIRQQAESAARNAAAGAVGRLRRDTSLVNQASQLTGRAIRKGEAAWKKRGAAGPPAAPRWRRRPAPPGQAGTAMCAAPRCSRSTRRRTTASDRRFGRSR